MASKSKNTAKKPSGVAPKKPKIVKEKLLPGDEMLMNVSDFNSMKLTFEISNSTTGLSFKKDFKVLLIQIFEKGMELEIPENSCRKGHFLMMKITTVNLQGGDLKFETTAKVDSCSGIDEGSDAAVVSLVQFDEQVWKKLNSAFNRRQEEIEKFLSSVRGYD